MLSHLNTFRFRSKALLKFLSINFLFSLIIEFQYILETSGIDGIWSTIFVYSALISNTLMIYLAAFMIFLPFLFIKSLKPHYLLFVPFTILLQLLAVTDVGIYKIFKFHINAVVINFFTTEGAWDSIYLGSGTITTIGIIILLMIILEFILMRKSLSLPKKRMSTMRKSNHIRYVIAILLVIVLVDKLSYVVADLYNNTQITRFLKLYPLYQPLTMKRTMDKVFGFKVNRENKFKFKKGSSTLNYPKGEIVLPKQSEKPNIVWIVIDGFRNDMVNSDITPATASFAERSQVFQQHLSGGNATRFGIFSMFYGIYAYNWHQFLGERRSPVFLDQLMQLGYNFNILSSTRLTYPEFRKTAFIKMPDKIKDDFQGKRSDEKDRAQVDYFKEWMKGYQSDKPFFTFLFLDAAHSRVYPKNFEKFKTVSKETNYLFVSKKSAQTAKLNYVNSLWYQDHLIKEVLDEIEKKEIMDDTIILITGDHGEEFLESGFFGHNSAFSKEQLNVPMILYVPGMKPKNYEYMTSHLDLPATFFDLLGVKAAPDSYSHGRSMFEENTRSFAVACSWNNCSYVADNHTIVFSMETYNSGIFQVRDKKYKEVEDSSKVLKEYMTNILKMMKDFSRFSQ